MKNSKLTSQSPPSPDVAFLRRVSFGIAPNDLANFNAKGTNLSFRVRSWVDEQLNSLPTNLIEMDISSWIAHEAFYSLDTSLSVQEVWEKFYVDADKKFTNNHLKRPVCEHEILTALRAVNSDYQLFERLSMFWHDHFFVSSTNKEAGAMWQSWDSTVRTGIMGNYYEYLRNVVQHPAFLSFFENDINIGVAPHKKMVRALFEQHTLGTPAYFGEVEATGDVPNYLNTDNVPDVWKSQPKGYSEDDIASAGYMLMGWGGLIKGADAGTFFFNTQHAITSSDQTILNHEYEEKMSMLAPTRLFHYMAKMLTAEYLKPVICCTVWPLILRQQNTLRHQLKRCYMTLFKHKAMFDPKHWGHKKARPFEMFVHVCRACECQRKMRMETLEELNKQKELNKSTNSDNKRLSSNSYELKQTKNVLTSKLNVAGQRLYQWRDYDGYPHDSLYWASGSTMVMTLKLIDEVGAIEENNFLDPAKNQQMPFLKILPITKANVSILTPTNIVNFWANRIWQITPDANTLAPFVEFFSAPVKSNEPWDSNQVIDLSISPDVNSRKYNHYQWNRKIRALVTGLMAHPYAMLR